MVIIYVSGQYANQGLWTWVVSILLIASCIVLGLKSYKKLNNGYLTLSECLKIGIGIALIASIFSVVWTLLLVTTIEPDIMEQTLEVAREKMYEQNQNITDEQVEMGVSMARKMSSPGISSAIIIIVNLFYGLVISVIAGLIMRKED